MPVTLAPSLSTTRRDVNLLEDVAINPLTRVDRDACVIFGVKILGRESPNRHGLAGVKGTVYTLEAMERARPLYLHKKVNVNHPPRTNPGQERDAEDRCGKFIHVYVHEGELYGDLKMLPSHRMTPVLLDAAEDPDLHDCFAMSHNARGVGDVFEGKFVVAEIPEVRSVDVVADGGTNASLFENREPAMPTPAVKPNEKKTLRSLLEAAPFLKGATQRVKDAWAHVLEMDDYASMEMDPPAPPMPAAGAGEAGPEVGHQEHLANMIKAIVMDDSLTAEQKVDKIDKACELLKEADEEPAEGEEGAGGAGGEGPPAKEKAKETPESAEAAKRDQMESKERQELELFRAEKRCRDLCEGLQYQPEPLDLAVLAGLRSDALRREYVKKQKAARAAAAAPPARKVGPSTSIPAHLLEGAGGAAGRAGRKPGEEADGKAKAGYWKS